MLWNYFVESCSIHIAHLKSAGKTKFMFFVTLMLSPFPFKDRLATGSRTAQDNTSLTLQLLTVFYLGEHSSWKSEVK